MNNGRLFLAALVAPLVLPSVLVVHSMYQGVPIGEIQLSLLFFLPFSYLASAIFGVPMFWFYKALGWRHVVAYVLGGALVGALAGSLLWWWWGAGATRHYFVFCPAVWALSALAFWLVLYGGRRDGATEGEI